MDVLVMVGAPSFTGALIEARPIGLFQMLDGGEPDDKILAVPNSDPLFKDYRDLGDVPRHFLAEVQHFFSVYKDLQGVKVQPIGWKPGAEARAAISRAMRLYQAHICQLPDWLLSQTGRVQQVSDDQ